MHPSFESLHEQLLRAGVAPRRVRRYVVELREHLADLTEQECAAGLDANQARDRARILLGGNMELAQAMINSTNNRSLSVRAPWLVFAMWPVLLLMAAIFLSAVLLMHLLGPVRGLTPAQMPDGYRILIGCADIVVNYVVAGALAAGCIAVALRQRLASGWIWVGLCLIAAFSGILGFHTHVVQAAAGHQAGVTYSVLPVVYLNDRPDLTATLGVAAIHAAILFAIAAAAYRVLRMRLQAAAP